MPMLRPERDLIYLLSKIKHPFYILCMPPVQSGDISHVRLHGIMLKWVFHCRHFVHRTLVVTYRRQWYTHFEMIANVFMLSFSKIGLIRIYT